MKETNVEFDYCYPGSAVELGHDLDLEFQQAGWYQKDNCTVLIVHCEMEYKAYVWNKIDPRKLFAELLDLPVFKN